MSGLDGAAEQALRKSIEEGSAIGRAMEQISSGVRLVKDQHGEGYIAGSGRLSDASVQDLLAKGKIKPVPGEDAYVKA